MIIQKRKALLLVVCFMMIGVIASLISGCGGGGGGGGGGGTEEPQYGGVLTVIATSDPQGWDDAITGGTAGNPHSSTSGCYQCLWSGDWTKGKAGGYGTNEVDWIIPGPINLLDSKTGYIAESWEIGDDYIIFHLRDGVRWENRSPTKGRAVNADDVVTSINRNKISGCYLAVGYPALAAAMSASKVDDTTVRIDCTADEMGELLSMIDFMYIYPKDVIDLYGNMNDWTRAIGTGPFYVKQYVAGSQVYMERNPVYWETNPIGLGQGDQLPYLDGVRVLIQPDTSTQDSLFITGQIDIHNVDYDRAVQIMDAAPDAKFVEYFSDAAKAVICMRLDKADKPYQDVRVRQALQLAIDGKKIVDELYGGEGEYLYWPLAYCKEYAGAYLALEDYPASVQELFTQNVPKAKQLLADAGYPDGFSCEIIMWTYQPYVEQMEVVKDMWADIGVDLTIKTQDLASLYATMMFHNYSDLAYWGYSGAATYFKGTNWYGTGLWNGSLINDPVLNDYRDQMMAAYPDEDEAMAIHREMLPYLEEQCYVIQVAGSNTYRFWWPWVKNYNGEGSLGYYKYINNGFGGLSQYIWIDQDLKESMGF